MTLCNNKVFIMDESRIGVYVCWCGSNISLMVDVDHVAKEIGKLPGVIVSKDYKYMCSDPGQDMIINDIKEFKLERVVVATCSPRMHEVTFRSALEKAGINPYMLQIANIREHVSWVHTNRTEATEKAIMLVSAAVRRVNYHEALEKRYVDVNPNTLIIGGGISGLSAALEIADSGEIVYLVEKSNKLGGMAADIDLTFPYMSSAKQMIEPIIYRVENHAKIKIFLDTQISDISGYIGNFETTINVPGGKKSDLKFGNIIVATGLKPFDPSRMPDYGYDILPNVFTSIEFEKMLARGKILNGEGKVPKNIAIIHCVGSRNKNYHPYCSRTCCMVALKFANQIRSSIPEANIFDIYSDMRSFGKGCEEFYESTSRRNIMFLVYDQKNGLPRIEEAGKKEDCSMLIKMKEELFGDTIEVPADMVILMVGMEAQEDAKDIARVVGISMCGNAFFMEKHPKLDPVATTTDGVYIVGSCQGPKDIPDSITQAKAAAVRVLATIEVGSVEMEANTTYINENICCGCQTCIKVCPYSAISFNAEKKISVVNEALCKGCGTCGSACPTGATHIKHFTDEQILSQIEGLMHPESA